MGLVSLLEETGEKKSVIWAHSKEDTEEEEGLIHHICVRFDFDHAGL